MLVGNIIPSFLQSFEGVERKEQSGRERWMYHYPFNHLFPLILFGLQAKKKKIRKDLF